MSPSEKRPDREQGAASVFVGLGSNMGDREGALRGAIRALKDTEDIEVVAVSSFRETEPVGGPPQGPFINAVAQITTYLAPEQLMRSLQEIEGQFGRERKAKWGPRRLDLDILLYNKKVLDLPRLRIPHPLMHKRRFVLKPMCELAPHRRHPTIGRTMEELLALLREDGDGGRKRDS